MKRIDSAGSLNGRWADKNPATGAPGTTLQADWLNQVQEEIASVIENAAGGATPLNPASQRQLLDSIVKLIAQRRALPTRLEPAQRGGFAFPLVQTLEEMRGTIQSDSSRVTVSLTLDLEEPRFTAPTWPTRQWAFILSDGALPKPLESTIGRLLRWASGSGFVIGAYFGGGNATLAQTIFSDDGVLTSQNTALGQCFFCRIKEASDARNVGKYAILIRQGDGSPELQAGSIICEFSYFI